MIHVRCFWRRFSSTRIPKKLTTKPDPHEISSDYVGPADKTSNIRPYVRQIPKDETPLARRYRLKRIEVEDWNQEFWSKHNKRFYDEKKDFIRRYKLSENDDVSAEKLSIFYRHFLNKNKRIHALYNLSWYIKNYQLLVLAFLVEIQKFYFKWKRK